MTRQGRALSPSGLLPHFLPRLSFLSMFLRKGVGLGDRAPAIPPRRLSKSCQGIGRARGD